MVREIPLTRGQVALVDDEDFDRVSAFKWTLQEGDTNRYAFRSIGRRGPRSKVFLHRLVLNAPKGTQVDHINGDGLDCRKANLRLATHQQNNINRRPMRPGQFKGVYVHPGRKSWYAKVTCNRVVHRLGTFPTAEEAARAYDRKASELFGEFANLNFPDGRGRV